MIAALQRPQPWPPPGPARRCLLAAPATRQPWARQALLYSGNVGRGQGERPLRGHPAGRQGGAGPRQLALKDFACREPPGFRNVPEPWKKTGPWKLCTRRWARSSQWSAGHTWGGSLPEPPGISPIWCASRIGLRTVPGAPGSCLARGEGRSRGQKTQGTEEM